MDTNYTPGGMPTAKNQAFDQYLIPEDPLMSLPQTQNNRPPPPQAYPHQQNGGYNNAAPSYRRSSGNMRTGSMNINTPMYNPNYDPHYAPNMPPTPSNGRASAASRRHSNSSSKAPSIFSFRSKKHVRDDFNGDDELDSFYDGPSNYPPTPVDKSSVEGITDMSMSQLTSLRDRDRYPSLAPTANTSPGAPGGGRTMSLRSMTNSTFDTTPIIPILNSTGPEKLQKYRQNIASTQRKILAEADNLISPGPMPGPYPQGNGPFPSHPGYSGHSNYPPGYIPPNGMARRGGPPPPQFYNNNNSQPPFPPHQQQRSMTMSGYPSQPPRPYPNDFRRSAGSQGYSYNPNIGGDFPEQQQPYINNRNSNPNNQNKMVTSPNQAPHPPIHNSNNLRPTNMGQMNGNVKNHSVRSLSSGSSSNNSNSNLSNYSSSSTKGDTTIPEEEDYLNEGKPLIDDDTIQNDLQKSSFKSDENQIDRKEVESANQQIIIGNGNNSTADKNLEKKEDLTPSNSNDSNNVSITPTKATMVSNSISNFSSADDISVTNNGNGGTNSISSTNMLATPNNSSIPEQTPLSNTPPSTISQSEFSTTVSSPGMLSDSMSRPSSQTLSLSSSPEQSPVSRTDSNQKDMTINRGINLESFHDNSALSTHRNPSAGSTITTTPNVSKKTLSLIGSDSSNISTDKAGHHLQLESAMPIISKTNTTNTLLSDRHSAPRLDEEREETIINLKLENQSLLNEIRLITFELADSVKRELGVPALPSNTEDLSNPLSLTNMNNTERSNIVAQMAKDLNMERRKRAALEEQLNATKNNVSFYFFIFSYY